MLTVFVSHSSDDAGPLSLVTGLVEAWGFHVWRTSELIAGEQLANGLKTAIDEADVCIFIATPRSIESGWCMAELGAFWGAGKRVVTFLADPTVEPVHLPPQFQGSLRAETADQLRNSLNEAARGRVQRTATGFCTKLGHLDVDVSIGGIQYLPESPGLPFIALPANEFFDDECINDRESSLGAFVQHHFPGHVEQIQQLVRNALDGTGEPVEKRPGQHAISYGLGHTVFLDRPLGAKLQMAMVSVTTQRADAGLKGDASSLLAGIRGLQRLMANFRLGRVRLPLMVSGQGGLRPEISLLCTLIAFGEASGASTARGVRRVEIVVYGGSDGEPDVQPASIRRALLFASRFLG